MKNRFTRALYEFLVKEDISLESGIVNDLVFKMIGLGEVEGYRPGFDLETSRNDDKEKVTFTLPKKLKITDIVKCLKFLNVEEDQYRSGEPLVLSEQFVFETLIPAFKNHFEELKKTNPAEITKYKVQSRALLESSATSTIKEYAGKARIRFWRFTSALSPRIHRPIAATFCHERYLK